MSLQIPDENRKKAIAKAFVSDLESYTYHSPDSNRLCPVICSVCDSIPREPHWTEWVDIDVFSKYCSDSQLHKKHLPEEYNSGLVACYNASDTRLEDYCLSPKSRIDKGNNAIMCCKNCLKHLRKNFEGGKKSNKRPPPESCGYLVGDLPSELKELNSIESALISKIRIHSQTFVIFGGCHKQMKGWHTFFRNRPEYNVANVNLLANSGMHGRVMVVLAGPFTPLQVALARQASQVDAAKVCKAWKWLKENNYHFADDTIPEESENPNQSLLMT